MEYLDYLDGIYEEIIDEFGDEFASNNLVEISCQICGGYVLTVTKKEAEDLTVTCPSCW